jgi:phytoene synthase
MTEAAYEHCRRIARASGSSFYAGMRLLPPERRAALFAVYALARRIDDVADGDLPQPAKLAELERLRAALADLPRAADPVLLALADAARRFPIPLEAFGDLVDGAEMDARGTAYETWPELELYCRRVAGSIGRLALGVFECSDRARGAALADDLGVALQVGNVLRDLTEDRASGRFYLPRADLERFDGDLPLAIAFEAQRGLEWLERGLGLIPLLDRRSAAAVLAMAGKYRVLLERIAADPALALRGRLTLRPWEKGLVLARSLAGVGA